MNKKELDEAASQPTTARGSADPLAIVGMGCMFPKADNLQDYWANIKEGVDAITDIPESHWSPSDYFDPDPKAPDHTYAKRGGFLSPVDFDPLAFGLPPNTLEATDTSQLLGLHVARATMEDAGYGEDREFDRSRVSVIMGVTGTLELAIPLGARLGHPIWRKAMRDAGLDEELVDDLVERIGAGYVPWQEASFPGLLGNVVAGRIANRLDLGGTNCAVDAACASSLSALHLASMELETGRSDMVLCGGIDTFNDIFMFMCFSKTPALSASGHARPFAKDGDGTILGEGLGMLAIKRLKDAERDGDTIHAVIRAVGTSSDGKGNAIYAPCAAGQTQAMQACYTSADLTPDTIELLEGHGTGTVVGDATEVRSMTEIFSPAAGEGAGSWCALGSVKSQIGHTKAAAGVAGLIKAALALKNKILPPTIKVDQPIDELAPGKTPFYVNIEKRPWVGNPVHPRRAAVSAFGFGGSNFHAALEEYLPKKLCPDFDGEVQILAFSADTRAELAALLKDFPAKEAWENIRAAAARTRERFTSEASCRMLIVAEHCQDELQNLLDSARETLKKAEESVALKLPQGVSFGEGAVAGKLAVLFPGQGAQYAGMLRDLACQFPEFLEQLTAGDAIFAAKRDEQGHADSSKLSDYIYPHPIFADAERALSDAALRATEIAQPAIGVVSIGVLSVLAGFGVQADAYAGHSYGELTALAASGRIDNAALTRLSVVRGTLMAAAGSNVDDAGAMLAVHALLEDVATVAEEVGVVVANKNTPRQVVLSGGSDAIGRAQSLLKKRRIASTMLAVAAGFHSVLVESAEVPFAKALNDEDFKPGAVPVYANTTAAVYPEDADRARALLAGQLSRPVEFVAEIRALYDSGVRTFVEAGPGGGLSRMVDAILADQDDFLTVAVDASKGKKHSGIYDLANALAGLAAGGHELTLSNWDPQESATLDPAKKKPAMTIAIGGANYVQQRKPIPARNQRPVVSHPSSGDPKPPPSAAAKRDPAPHKPSMSPSIATPTSISTATPPRVASPDVAPNVAHSPAPSLNSTQQHKLQDAMASTDASLAALQRMHEDTARLHQQFLEGQSVAQASMGQLFSDQQRIFNRDPGNGEVAAQVAPAAPAPHSPRPPVASAPAMPPATPSVAPITAAPVSTAPTTAPTTALVTPVEQTTIKDDVTPVLLEVVAEKTGYPTEMLELDMLLDADLGIDSIKRVEILSALTDRLPGAPEASPEHLSTLHSLQDVAEFLRAHMSATSAAPVTTAQVATASNAQIDDVTTVLLEVVAEKTGYPTDMLELDMLLDADLGIDSIKRVEILSALTDRLPGAPEASPEHLGTLHSLHDVAEFLRSHMSATSAVPVATSPVATAGQSQSDDVTPVLLEEKTGYPTDMLELDMELEEDLGIDSIKRVEILSALTGRLTDPPAATPEQLGKLNTLGDVAAFFGADLGAVVDPINALEALPAQDLNDITQALLEVVAEKTGYPIAMLELDMGLEADLGIDSIKRVEIFSSIKDLLPNAKVVSSEEMSQLSTLRQVAASLSESRPLDPSVATPKESADPMLESPPVSLIPHVVPLNEDPRSSLVLGTDAPLWVAGTGPLAEALVKEFKRRGMAARAVELDTDEAPEALSGLVILTPDAGFTFASLGDAFHLITLTGSALRKAGGGADGALLATVARLNGAFALPGGPDLPDDPAVNDDFCAYSGGLAGISKSASHEWPEVTIRALDLEPSLYLDAADAARRIATELAFTGPLEVGICSAGLNTVKLAQITAQITDEITTDKPLSSSLSPGQLSPGDAVLVTGGARGVTAQVALALAEAVQPTLILCGRSPLPEAEAPWLAGVSGEGAIKKAIMEAHGNASGDGQGKKISPREVHGEYVKIAAAREIRANIAALQSALQAAGSTVIYLQADMSDESSVDALLASIEQRLDGKPVVGFIHGAGVLADALIEVKTQDEISRVFNTKVPSAARLMAALPDLKFAAFFSSTTARLGRRGQSDYAMANEVLNKLAALEATRREHCRVVSLNWGPWDGGMVTPALKKLFASEGVGVIGLKAGGQVLLQEIARAPSAPVEVMVMGALPPALASSLVSFSGSVTGRPAAIPAPEPRRMAEQQRLAFEWDLSIERFPLLRSHVMDGQAVAPLAVIAEWLAQGALHVNPGLGFLGYEHLRILKGLTLSVDEVRKIQIMTGKPSKNGTGFLVPVTLVSAVGDTIVRHASAQILLGNDVDAPGAPRISRADGSSNGTGGAGKGAGAYDRSIYEIYDEILFHGPDLQGIVKIIHLDDDGFRAASRTTLRSGILLDGPPRKQWIASPLALDVSFQLMIVWSEACKNARSLPCYVDSFRMYQSAFPEDNIIIAARVTAVKGHTVHADMEFVDGQGRLVATIKGYECVLNAALAGAFERNRLVADPNTQQSSS